MKNHNSIYIAEFLRLKTPRSKKTQAFYKTGLLRYLAHVGASWPPTPELVTGWLDLLKADGLAQGSIAAYYRALRGWVNWLVKSGKLTVNPLDQVSAPKTPKRKVPGAPRKQTTDDLFTDLEGRVEFALRFNQTKRDWIIIRDLAIVSFMLGTGARVGEVQRLTVDALNIDEGLAHFDNTKDGQPRDVKFNGVVAADLRLWLDVRKQLNIPATVPYVFTSKQRTGYWVGLTHWGIRSMLEKRCEMAGIDYINPHAFRHAYAIRALENGATLVDIRDQLGHESLKTTDIYLRVFSDERGRRLDQASPRK